MLEEKLQQQSMGMKRTQGFQNLEKGYLASSGNRTRAARVAGEHSTTEPTMLCIVECVIV